MENRFCGPWGWDDTQTGLWLQRQCVDPGFWGCLQWLLLHTDMPMMLKKIKWIKWSGLFLTGIRWQRAEDRWLFSWKYYLPRTIFQHTKLQVALSNYGKLIASPGLTCFPRSRWWEVAVSNSYLGPPWSEHCQAEAEDDLRGPPSFLVFMALSFLSALGVYLSLH